ncbi:hypothetical protein FRC02_007359, partial [Tulasnella sp. 418]
MLTKSEQDPSSAWSSRRPSGSMAHTADCQVHISWPVRKIYATLMEASQKLSYNTPWFRALLMNASEFIGAAHRQCGRVQDMANSNARVLDCVPSRNGSECTLTREQSDGPENDKTSLDNIHNHANHSCTSIMDSFSSHHLSSEVLLASILHPSTLDRRAIARWAQEHLRLGIACHKSDGELINITSSLLPNVIWENIIKEETPTSFEKLCTSIAKMPTNDLQSGYISDVAELGSLSQLKAGLEEMLQKVESFEPSSPNPSNVSQISPSLTSPTVGNESGLLLGGDSDRSRTVAAGS